MSADEAKEYGLIDTVITNAAEIVPGNGVPAAATK
jgi:ATP-dependent protease ClpP protease subunit